MSAVTADQLRSELVTQCKHAGGVRQFALAKGVSHTLVSLTLSGAREPAETIANAVGFMRLVSYIPIKEKRT